VSGRVESVREPFFYSGDWNSKEYASTTPCSNWLTNTTAVMSQRYGFFSARRKDRNHFSNGSSLKEYLMRSDMIRGNPDLFDG